MAADAPLPPFLSRISDLPADFEGLLADADADGFQALRRLEAEWHSGENRFARTGEGLFLAAVDGASVGICGLNQDPFGDADVARVRRLFVRPRFRRQGIARALVGRVEEAAGAWSDWIQLRTHDETADAFYRALGYLPVIGEAHVTHRKQRRDATRRADR